MIYYYTVSLYNIKNDREYLKYTIASLISCIENALSCQYFLQLKKKII